MTLDQYLASIGEKPSAFAKRTGLAKSTVSRLVRGQLRPSWDMVAKVERATEGAVQANDWARQLGEEDAA